MMGMGRMRILGSVFGVSIVVFLEVRDNGHSDGELSGSDSVAIANYVAFVPVDGCPLAVPKLTLYRWKHRSLHRH